MRKAPEAFRTISEAADALDTPAHVLRFWESKFTQVKPVKRAGGRRYYRPADIDLLSGIKLLLHDQGMTIRGVQKLLQEKGARHVAGLAPLTGDVLDGSADPVLRIVAEASEPDPGAGNTAETSTVAESAPELQTPAPDASEAPDMALSQPDPVAVDPAPPSPTAPPEQDAPQTDAAQPEDPVDPADDVQEDAPAEPDTPVPEPEPEPEPVSEHDPQPSEDPATQEPDAADADTRDAAAQLDPTDDDQPEPALAALLDAAADTPTAEPARFARIAHALRTSPPDSLARYAPTLERLEALVTKLAARAD